MAKVTQSDLDSLRYMQRELKRIYRNSENGNIDKNTLTMIASKYGTNLDLIIGEIQLDVRSNKYPNGGYMWAARGVVEYYKRFPERDLTLSNINTLTHALAIVLGNKPDEVHSRREGKKWLSRKNFRYK